MNDGRDNPSSISGEGFRPSQRLKTPQDFSHLRLKPKSYRSKAFLCFYKCSRIDAPYARLGLSVSKKVGCAVRRNRLKRICREFFRRSPLRELSLDLLIVVSSRLDKNRSADYADQFLKEQLCFLEKKLCQNG